MRYYLAEHAALKYLENPCVYDIRSDDLYELDEPAFVFLGKCAESGGADPVEGDSEFLEYCVTEGLLQAEVVARRRPVAVKSPTP
jgi:hypothetical protein